MGFYGFNVHYAMNDVAVTCLYLIYLQNKIRIRDYSVTPKIDEMQRPEFRQFSAKTAQLGHFEKLQYDLQINRHELL